MKTKCFLIAGIRGSLPAKKLILVSPSNSQPDWQVALHYKKCGKPFCVEGTVNKNFSDLAKFQKVLKKSKLLNF